MIAMIVGHQSISANLNLLSIQKQYTKWVTCERLTADNFIRTYPLAILNQGLLADINTSIWYGLVCFAQSLKLAAL